MMSEVSKDLKGIFYSQGAILVCCLDLPIVLQCKEYLKGAEAKYLSDHSH